MDIEILSEQRCFGGIQGFYRHASAETGGDMKFGVYMPPLAQGARRARAETGTKSRGRSRRGD